MYQRESPSDRRLPKTANRSRLQREDAFLRTFAAYSRPLLFLHVTLVFLLNVQARFRCTRHARRHSSDSRCIPSSRCRAASLPHILTSRHRATGFPSARCARSCALPASPDRAHRPHASRAPPSCPSARHASAKRRCCTGWDGSCRSAPVRSARADDWRRFPPLTVNSAGRE